MKDLKDLMKNWFISYDIYTDKFQIYDDVVFRINKNHFIVKQKDDFLTYINKTSHQPVLFEINNLYDKVNIDVNDLKKTDVINLIEPYIINIWQNQLKQIHHN